MEVGVDLFAQVSKAIFISSRSNRLMYVIILANLT
jgi:hypothetical protein